MSALFMKVVNLSITGSWLILAVFLVRYLLKKAPKWTVLLLWALVAVRLILPFSFESAFSLVPKNETIVPSVANVTRIITAQKPVIEATVQKPAIDNIVQKPAIDAAVEKPTIDASVEKPPIDAAVIPANDVVRPVIEQRLTIDTVSAATTTPEQSVISYLAFLWIIGIVVMLAYAIISYLRLKKSVEPSIEIRDRILASDDVKSPFILGMLRLRIYVPSSMSGQTLEYVISHEMAHIKRGDHWWKPLGYLLLSVYWFNPLCWLAYLLLCRDIEMACDEKVIRGMDNKSKAAYSEALLSCSMPRRAITACPLAFGEVGVKERVKSVFNYKKPAFWIIIVAIIACIVVAVCFLSTPKSSPTPSTSESSPESSPESSTSESSAGSLTPKSPPMSFDNMKIVWATASDSRPDIPTTRYLSEDAFDELTSQLATLKFYESDPTLKQRTPSHTLTIYTEETGLFAIAGYDDGKTTALVHDGALYRINDDAFSEYLGGTCSSQSSPYELDQLNAYFPEYFNLQTSKGLEVYVWQTGPSSYSCSVMPGTNRIKIPEELCKLKGVTIAEMKMILSTYDLPAEEIFICPFHDHPISSLWYNIDEGDLKMLKEMFFTQKTIRANVAHAAYGLKHQLYGDRIYEKSLNAHLLRKDDKSHLPVFRFDTKEELDYFKVTFCDIFAMDDSDFKEYPSFNEATLKYDDRFFADNTLMLSYIEACSSYRYGVHDVDYDPSSFCMYVTETNRPKDLDHHIERGWFLLVEMKDTDIKNCKSFDAQYFMHPELPAVYPINYHVAKDFISSYYAQAWPEEKKELDRICASTIGGINPRQMAIAHGRLNPEAPRLRLKRVKQICSELSSDQYVNASEFERAVAEMFDDFCAGPDFYGDGETGVTRREYYLNDEGTEYIKLEGPLVIYVNKTTDEQKIMFEWSDK